MDKYISAVYIKEKMRPIEQLIKTVNTACDENESDNVAEKISPSRRKEIVFAFAVIAKELGENIPDV